MTSETELQDAIARLYGIVAELEGMYPSRHFTPDGHMVGSLGEVVAAERYHLVLFEASHPVHDAKDADGRLVQVKATQGTRVALSDCPDYLIVLQLSKSGEFTEIYNGPGKPVWNATGKPQKTGQRSISVSKLVSLSSDVRTSDRI